MQCFLAYDKAFVVAYLEQMRRDYEVNNFKNNAWPWVQCSYCAAICAGLVSG